MIQIATKSDNSDAETLNMLVRFQLFTIGKLLRITNICTVIFENITL